MQRPNAFTIGDRLIADPEGHWVTVKAFVKPAGGRQLVRVKFPDGTHRNRSFESLRRLRDLEQERVRRLDRLAKEAMRAWDKALEPRD